MPKHCTVVPRQQITTCDNVTYTCTRFKALFAHGHFYFSNIIILRAQEKTESNKAAEKYIKMKTCTSAQTNNNNEHLTNIGHSPIYCNSFLLPAVS